MLQIEPQDCPVVDVDTFSDEFLSDPFPQLATLRNLGDVVFLRKYGVCAVARHAEVNAVLRDPEVFSNASGVGYSNLETEKAWRSASIILEVDPPMHTRLGASRARGARGSSPAGRAVRRRGACHDLVRGGHLRYL